MLIITLSGILENDSVQRKDNKGRNYIMFRVICDEPDYKGNLAVNIFRCYGYNLNYSELKKGDFVFLTGNFRFSVRDGIIDSEILVLNLSLGNIIQ